MILLLKMQQIVRAIKNKTDKETGIAIGSIRRTRRYNKLVVMTFQPTDVLYENFITLLKEHQLCKGSCADYKVCFD